MMPVEVDEVVEVDEQGASDGGDDVDEDQTLTDNVLPTEPDEGGQLTVIVVAGPEAGQWFRVPPEGCLIGRREDAAIHLTDPGVSRRHAAIERADDDSFVLRDLGSRNGVHVRGQRVTTHQLRDGDHIQLSGASLLRARFRGPVESEILEGLQRSTTSDPLTGVANRRYLMNRLSQELSFAWRHKVPISVLLLDVVELQTVNDLYGHRAGDAVLKAAAEVLQASIRVEDVVGRLGGDEFVIICRGYPPALAEGFARRLSEVVQQATVEVAAGQRLRMSLRIGIAGCTIEQLRQERLDPMALLVRANAALVDAKRGPERVARWQPPPGTEDDPRRWIRATNPEIRVANGSDKDGT